MTRPTPRTPASTTPREDRVVESFTVVFELPDGSTRMVRAGAEEHILDAARRAGLTLPSACEQGWDLACAVRVLEGELDNSDALRYYVEDREAGFALICTAKARSDLRLRTHQRDAMRAHRDAHGLPAPRGSWGAGIEARRPGRPGSSPTRAGPKRPPDRSADRTGSTDRGAG